MCFDGFLCEHFFYFCDIEQIDIWANWWLSPTDMRDNQILVRIQICSNLSRKKEKSDRNNKILNILSLFHRIAWKT